MDLARDWVLLWTVQCFISCSNDNFFPLLNGKKSDSLWILRIVTKPNQTKQIKTKHTLKTGGYKTVLWLGRLKYVVVVLKIAHHLFKNRINLRCLWNLKFHWKMSCTMGNCVFRVIERLKIHTSLQSHSVCSALLFAALFCSILDSVSQQWRPWSDCRCTVWSRPSLFADVPKNLSFMA